jgi:hypothetical protein
VGVAGADLGVNWVKRALGATALVYVVAQVTDAGGG